jgi:hypothetical protein
MHFDVDAFISYAHLDNIELIEGRRGWVANLHRALEVRVGQLLGKPPHIWRDPKLQGNDIIAETLAERLRRVAALVTVVSPRYVKSEWTLRELHEFWRSAEMHGGIRVRDKARVFKVLKTPVDRDETPPELRNLLGYEFFRVDPETGKVRELDEVFGPEAQAEFWIKLDDLAHDMCALLEMLEDNQGALDQRRVAEPALGEAGWADCGAAARNGASAVFVAHTTTDLKEQHDALKRDLEQHGYTVLPDRPVPLVAEEVEAFVRDNLARCRMSVHLVGRHYSFVPEGGDSSLTELQHELATERARAGRFSRIVWLPPALQVEDERQRALIERLRLDQRLGEHADLLETGFEDLRTVVRQWLERETARPRPADTAVDGGVAPRLYLIADARDTEAIRPWADALFNDGLEVFCSACEGDEAQIREYHEENLTICDGVVIFYASGNEVWVRRKLRELQKSPGWGRTRPLPPAVICLLPPRTPEKERFRTHDALVLPQWTGYQAADFAEFVGRLKAGRSA